MCVSYHAVHSEVVVLGLQLDGMGVVVADLCVARQEQTLVVHDPVKHLRHGGGNDRNENIYKVQGSSLLTFTDHCGSR